MEMEGEVVTGRGDGQEYVGMEEYQHRFREVLGYSPFPGTLNLRVDAEQKERLREEVEAREIESFEIEGARFSAVEAFPLELEGVEAALLEMEITHHPEEIAEIVAPVNLREELDLEDGDTVTCRVP